MRKLFLFFGTLAVILSCSKADDSLLAEESADTPTETAGTAPETESTTTSDPVPIPNDIWWNDEVFYEIFVRSFKDSNGDGIGDIQGIIDQLDYLNDSDPTTTSDLGITGLWLMPIFPSPSYHGYDVTNYRDINPDYGTMDDFRRLITEAHARGIKVIIDFVGNHTSDQHPWFTASTAGESKRDWYIWQETNPNFNGPWGQTVWHQRNNAYYYGLFWGGMPDLNFNTAAVTQEIKDITRFWATDVGVDGFRIDAVKHWVEEGSNQENTTSTLNWWRDYYAFQKSLSPSFMTVGEAWTSTQNILPYSDNRLDYCFEFDLASSIINGINSQSAEGLRLKVNQVTSNYAPFQYGTFLANHDQNRVFNRLGSSVVRAKLAASILLSLPGIPYLYYGEEIGMMGEKPDENIRRPMQWDATVNAGFTSGTPWHALNSNTAQYNVSTMQDDDRSLWSHYRDWIQLRKSTPALTQGRYKGLGSSVNSLFPFLRIAAEEGDSVLFVHNLSAQNQSGFSVNSISSTVSPGEYDLINVLDQTTLGTLTVNSGGGFSTTFDSLTLPPYGSVGMRLQAR